MQDHRKYKNSFIIARLFTACLFTQASAGVGGGGAGKITPPRTQSNLPFCTGVQISRDSLGAIPSDRIKTRENRRP